MTTTSDENESKVQYIVGWLQSYIMLHQSFFFQFIMFMDLVMRGEWVIMENMNKEVVYLPVYLCYVTSANVIHPCMQRT